MRKEKDPGNKASLLTDRLDGAFDRHCIAFVSYLPLGARSRRQPCHTKVGVQVKGAPTAPDFVTLTSDEHGLLQTARYRFHRQVPKVVHYISAFARQRPFEGFEFGRTALVSSGTGRGTLDFELLGIVELEDNVLERVVVAQGVDGFRAVPGDSCLGGQGRRPRLGKAMRQRTRFTITIDVDTLLACSGLKCRGWEFPVKRGCLWLWGRPWSVIRVTDLWDPLILTGHAG